LSVDFPLFFLAQGTKRKRRNISIKEIKDLKEGRAIYYALENATDPSAVEVRSLDLSYKLQARV